jgi:hypothetical protein
MRRRECEFPFATCNLIAGWLSILPMYSSRNTAIEINMIQLDTNYLIGLLVK